MGNFSGNETREINTSNTNNIDITIIGTQSVSGSSNPTTSPASPSISPTTSPTTSPSSDKEYPKISIKRIAYNQISFTASDDVGLKRYIVSQYDTLPPMGWKTVSGKTVTDCSELLVSTGTWYVWVEDQSGKVSKAPIEGYEITSNVGVGTTLSICEKVDGGR